MHTPLSEVIVLREIALKITKLSEAENNVKKTWFAEHRRRMVALQRLIYT